MAKQNEFKVGDTVTFWKGQFEGVVTAVHNITFLGKYATVYDVEWNGPETPLKCKDELGTRTRQGYVASQLRAK